MTALFFLFLEGQIHENQSTSPFIVILCYNFVETLFKAKLNTLVTKYTPSDTLKWNYVPLRINDMFKVEN